ncbi:MAG: beta-class carbonic anhydrase [Acidimicrobiales bacterium]
MNVVDELLKRASEYALEFRSSGLPSRPSKGVVVVTCMDARVNPWKIFGLTEGDAHVLRNAGGTVTDDVIRSIAISQRLLGTEEVVLVHHTGCGMLSITDEAFKDQVEQETGTRPPWDVEAFADLDEHLRQSLAKVVSSPFIPKKDAVRGFVFDVETGRLREVGLAG